MNKVEVPLLSAEQLLNKKDDGEVIAGSMIEFVSPHSLMLCRNFS